MQSSTAKPQDSQSNYAALQIRLENMKRFGTALTSNVLLPRQQLTFDQIDKFDQSLSIFLNDLESAKNHLKTLQPSLGKSTPLVASPVTIPSIQQELASLQQRVGNTFSEISRNYDYSLKDFKVLMDFFHENYTRSVQDNVQSTVRKLREGLNYVAAHCEFKSPTSYVDRFHSRLSENPRGILDEIQDKLQILEGQLRQNEAGSSACLRTMDNHYAKHAKLFDDLNSLLETNFEFIKNKCEGLTQISEAANSDSTALMIKKLEKKAEKRKEISKEIFHKLTQKTEECERFKQQLLSLKFHFEKKIFSQVGFLEKFYSLKLDRFAEQFDKIKLKLAHLKTIKPSQPNQINRQSSKSFNGFLGVESKEDLEAYIQSLEQKMKNLEDYILDLENANRIQKDKLMQLGSIEQENTNLSKQVTKLIKKIQTLNADSKNLDLSDDRSKSDYSARARPMSSPNVRNEPSEIENVNQSRAANDQLREENSRLLAIINNMLTGNLKDASLLPSALNSAIQNNIVFKLSQFIQQSPAKEKSLIDPISQVSIDPNRNFQSDIVDIVCMNNSIPTELRGTEIEIEEPEVQTENSNVEPRQTYTFANHSLQRSMDPRFDVANLGIRNSNPHKGSKLRKTFSLNPDEVIEGHDDYGLENQREERKSKLREIQRLSSEPNLVMGGESQSLKQRSDSALKKSKKANSDLYCSQPMPAEDSGHKAHLDALAKDNRKLRSLVSSLKKEKKDLEMYRKKFEEVAMELQMKVQQQAELEFQIMALNNEVNILSTTQKEWEEKTKRLQQKISEGSESTPKHQNEVAMLKEQLRSVEESFANLKENFTKEKNELMQKINSLELLKKDFERANDLIDRARAEEACATQKAEDIAQALSTTEKDNQRLASELELASIRIEGLEKKIALLESQHSHKEQLILTHEQELEVLKNRIGQYEEALRTSKQETAEYMQKIEIVNQEYESTCQILQSTDDENQDLREEIRQQKELIEDFYSQQREFERVEKQLGEVDHFLKNKLDENENLSRELKNSHNQIDQLNQKYKSLLARFEEMSEIREGETNKIEQLEAEFDIERNELRLQINTLESELTTAKSELTEIQTVIQQLTTEKTNYEIKIEHQKKKVDKAKSSIRHQMEVLTKFMSLCVSGSDASKLRIPRLSHKIKQIYDKSQFYLEQSQFKESKLQSVVQDIGQQDQLIDRLKIEVDSLKLRITELENALDQKQVSINHITAQHEASLKALSEETQRIQAQLTHAGKELKDRDSKIEAYLKESKLSSTQMQAALDSLQTEIKNHKNTIAHLEATNKQLSKMLQEKEEDFNKQHQESQNITESILKTNSEKVDELEKKLKSASNTIELLNIDKIRLENEVTILTESIKHKEEQLKKEKQALEKALEKEKAKMRETEVQGTERLTRVEQEHVTEKRRLSDLATAKEQEAQFIREEAERTNNKLKKELAETSSRLYEVEISLKKAIEMMNVSQAELHEKSHKVIELEKQLMDERVKSENLQFKLDEMILTTSQREQNLEQIQRERIETLTKEFIGLKDKVRNLENEVENRDKQIEQLKKHTDNSAKNDKGKMESLEKEMVSLKNSNESKSNELRQKIELINHLETKLKASNVVTVPTIVKEVEVQKVFDPEKEKELMSANEKIRSLESNIEAEKKTNTELSTKLKQQTELSVELQDSLAQFKSKAQSVASDMKKAEDEFRSKITNLEKEISVKNERILVLETQVQTLQTVNGTLATQQLAVNSQPKTESELNVSMNQKCDTCTALADKLAKREEKSSRSQADLQSKIVTLTKALTEGKQKFISYSSKFNKCYISILEQSNRFDSPLMVELRASDRKINSIQSKLSQVRLAFFKQRQMKALKENELSNAQEEIQSLKDTIKKNEDDRKSQTTVDKQTTEEIIKKNAEFERALSHIASLEKEITSKETDIGQLKHEKNLLIDEKTHLMRQLVQLKEQNMILTRDMEVLNSKMKKGDIKIELKDLRNENSTLKFTLQQVQEQLASISDDKFQLEENMNNIKKNYKEMMSRQDLLGEEQKSKERQLIAEKKQLEDEFKEMSGLFQFFSNLLKIQVQKTNYKLIEAALIKHYQADQALFELEKLLTREIRVALDREQSLKKIKEIIKESYHMRNQEAMNDSQEFINKQRGLNNPNHGVVVKIDNDKLAEELKKLEARCRDYENEKRLLKEEVEQLKYEKREMAQNPKSTPTKRGGFSMEDDVSLKENLKRLLFVFFGNLVKKAKNLDLYNELTQILGFSEDERREFLKMLETAYISDKIKSSLNLK